MRSHRFCLVQQRGMGEQARHGTPATTGGSSARSGTKTTLDARATTRVNFASVRLTAATGIDHQTPGSSRDGQFGLSTAVMVHSRWSIARVVAKTVD
jgi:hypothetical protein